MRPRSDGGETSATYMGERMDAPPTASPPMKRASTKAVKLGAAPVAMEVAENSAATHSRMLRRPYRLVSRPATVGADDAAEQERTEGPAKAQVAQMKALGKERAGARDDGDVEAEEQSAQRRRGRQEDQVAEINLCPQNASLGDSIVVALQTRRSVREARDAAGR